VEKNVWIKYNNMANKYSKYALKPYVSTYVDPGSVKVNQILAERYDKNKEKKDLVDRTLGSFNALQGDQYLVQEAKNEVRSSLKGIVQNGNYEDAGLLIDEAIVRMDTDRGLLAAKKSYDNRAQELEWIKKATFEGQQVLDFGRGRAENHNSYTTNSESGALEENIYQPLSEAQLDYNGAMSKLVKGIKGGTYGVSQGHANNIAKGLYLNYIRSNEGKQDFRRLMELELPQTLSYDERETLAAQDIMKRLKSFTNQYVHQLVPKNKKDKNINGRTEKEQQIVTNTMNKIKGNNDWATSNGYKATDVASIEDETWFNEKLLNLNNKAITQYMLKTDEGTQKGNEYMQMKQDQIITMSQIPTNQGGYTDVEARKFKYQMVDQFLTEEKMLTFTEWQAQNPTLLVDQDSKPLPTGQQVSKYREYKEQDKFRTNPDLVKFGSYINYVTDESWSIASLLQPEYENIDAGDATIGLGADITKKAIGYGLDKVFKTGLSKFAGGWMFTGLGLGSDIGELTYEWANNALDPNDNVRQSNRQQGGGEDNLWTQMGTMNELDRLLENITHIKRLNNQLGTHFTEEDIPMLQEKAENVYRFQTGADGANDDPNVRTGDELTDIFNDYDGEVYEGKYFKPNIASNAGLDAAKKANEGLSFYAPSDFNVWGVTEGSDPWKEIFSDGIGALKIEGVIAPSLMTSTQTKFVLQKPGKGDKKTKRYLANMKEGEGMDKMGLENPNNAASARLGHYNFVVMNDAIMQLEGDHSVTLLELSTAINNSLVGPQGNGGLRQDLMTFDKDEVVLGQQEINEAYMETMLMFLEQSPEGLAIVMDTQDQIESVLDAEYGLKRDESGKVTEAPEGFDPSVYEKVYNQTFQKMMFWGDNAFCTNDKFIIRDSYGGYSKTIN